MVVDPPFPGLAGPLPPAPSPDELVATITLPGERYVGVARLVVAGVATRLDLSFEDVDDLQLALESVLRVVFDTAQRATVSVTLDAEALALAIGPAGRELLERPLGDDAPREPIDLRTVLAQLVDRVSTRVEPSPAIELRVDVPSRT
jgi:hypothetical protein